MDSLYIGIDTSAYTTSVSVVNDKGEVVFDLRKMLNVKKGSKGLRQQEAVFQHINNIPDMIGCLSDSIPLERVESVSVSATPRNIEGSYMPVFKVGQGQAFILSKILDVKYNEISHQDGHIGSAFLSNNLKVDEFLALHISGGTTELLKVNKKNASFDVEIVGGTKDISAGQLIDRIGVELELNFPSGKEIDKFASTGKKIDRKVPVSTKGTWVNFSGTETYFKRLIDERVYSIEDISKSLLYSVTKSLETIIEKAMKEFKLDFVIVTGGVAANSYLRNELCKKFNNGSNDKIMFPDIKYCTDNAVGVAYIGSRIEKARI